MNIAFIARRYDRVGGTEVDLYHLTELLAKFGHRITVYCQQPRIAPPEGVVIRKVPSLLPGRLVPFLALAWLAPRTARSGGHDLLIGFTRLIDQDIVRCGGGTHRIFVQRMMETEGPIKKLLRGLSPYHNAVIAVERRQFRSGCRKILAISGIVREEIEKVYGVPGEKIEVIYDGIDTDRFHPSNRERYRQEIRESFGIPQDALLILFLGSGYKRKNLSTVIEALPRVEGKNIYCLVVGGDRDPESYAARARGLGIHDRVIFAGVQRGAERFYAAADLFVLPSLQEAFGNVILEAMASGLPVITSAVAGASELLTGELAPFVLEDPLDAEDLARKIGTLTDDALLQRLSQLVRKTAETYTLEANARAVEALCQTTIDERQP